MGLRRTMAVSQPWLCRDNLERRRSRLSLRRGCLSVARIRTPALRAYRVLAGGLILLGIARLAAGPIQTW